MLEVWTGPDDVLDSDQDGLYDWVEVNIYGTNPADPDTDGDGICVSVVRLSDGVFLGLSAGLRSRTDHRQERSGARWL